MLQAGLLKDQGDVEGAMGLYNAALDGLTRTERLESSDAGDVYLGIAGIMHMQGQLH